MAQAVALDRRLGFAGAATVLMLVQVMLVQALVLQGLLLDRHFCFAGASDVLMLVLDRLCWCWCRAGAGAGFGSAFRFASCQG